MARAATLDGFGHNEQAPACMTTVAQVHFVQQLVQASFLFGFPFKAEHEREGKADGGQEMELELLDRNVLRAFARRH
jgi:hypothetical protein